MKSSVSEVKLRLFMLDIISLDLAGYYRFRSGVGSQKTAGRHECHGDRCSSIFA